MKTIGVFGCILAMGVLLLGKSAVADVAPPIGYEEECTLEKQHYNDMACITCSGGGAVHPEDDDACDADANEADGYDFICRTRGASFNTEIWCKDSPGEIGPAGDPDDVGCSVVTPGKAGTSIFVLFFLLALIGRKIWSASRRSV